MSTDEPSKDCGCQSCDLGDVQGLACRAKKFEKQAEIMTAVASDLATYQTQYADARKAFAEAWVDISADLAATEAALTELGKTVDCGLDDQECLDEVVDDVFKDIEDCSPEPGCCVGDCEFDDEVPEDTTVAWLTARIDDYRRQTEANTACFTSLVTEAQTVTDQLTAIKAEVADLAQASGNDKAQRVRRYARWRIAKWRLQLTRLGHGFTSVAAYSDCLCKALQCIAGGWAAIAVLEGARAELTCLEATQEETCKHKKEQTLETIIEAFDRCCQPEAGEDEGTENQATAEVQQEKKT